MCTDQFSSLILRGEDGRGFPGFLHLFFAPLLCESDFFRELFPSAILELRVVGVRRFQLKDGISLGYSSLCKENGT